MSRPRLNLDFEGFCVHDLKVVGADIYSTKAIPLLAALKVDDEITRVEDYVHIFNNETDEFGDNTYPIPCPNEYLEAMEDDWYLVAHNVAFELAMILNSPSLRLWPKPKIENLICTAAKARFHGLPGKLELAGDALDLPIQKNPRGAALIRKFCKPQKTSVKASAPLYIKRIDPNTDDWREFKSYNRDDVETGRGIDKALPDIPAKYAPVFYMDLRMNLRGFPVDIEGVHKAQRFYDHFHLKLENRFKELSGGLAPSQVIAVRELLNDEYHCGLPDLTAPTIRDKLLEDDFFHPNAKEMLEIRAETARASIKKLIAFVMRTGADLRARGGFMYFGAGPGRWAGRGIQPQNFPRGIKALMKLLRAFYAWLATSDSPPSLADLETAALVFPNPLGVLSSALRGFIKAVGTKRIYAVDYSTIEVRILAWLAGEIELLDQLTKGLDPYIQFAGNHMYNVSPDTISKSDFRRQVAKSAILGCQYQIWIDAFIEYCKNQDVKITREEATNAVLSYRAANRAIVDFWGLIEKACILAVETKGEAILNNLRIRFELINDREFLCIYLPDGRPIKYYKPQVKERLTMHERKDRDGNVMLDDNGEPQTYMKRKRVLSYLTHFNGRITREYTYGGKLTQNVVEGIGSQIMGHGLVEAEKHGYFPIATVHDEAVTEREQGGDINELIEIVCDLPKCYEGLPITAEGAECIEYRKY